MTSFGSFPYEAIAGKRYKSPHKNDLSFAKGDRIRVLSLAPKDEEDDEDEDDDEPDQWLVGETLDGTKTGTFPASHVQAVPAEEAHESPAVAEVAPTQQSAPKSTDEDNTSKEEVVSSKAKIDAKAEEPTSQEAKETQQIVPEREITSPSTTPSQVVSAEATMSSPTDQAGSVSANTPAISQKPASPIKAPKPSGMAARIAAFNRPQEAAAPPPLPRGKPGGWKRPEPAAGAAKPVLPGPPPAQQSKPANIARPTAASPPVNAEEGASEATSQSNAGFSAADAQSSIKMSLKERMAALQRGDSSEAAASKPAAPPPKPAPGRIAEEKRKAALAGTGGVSAAHKSEEAPPAVDGESLEGEATEKGADTVQGGAQDAEEAKGLEPSGDGEVDGVEEEERTEEERESERRAAIAKRMASLGGRRMGGGPAIFGAPAPVPAKKPTGGDKTTTPKINTEEGLDEESSAKSGMETSKEEEPEPIQPGQTLAVPRRAAPPRKKKSTASSIQTAESAGSTSLDSPTRQDSKASIQSGLEKLLEGGEDLESKEEEGGKEESGPAKGVMAGSAAVGVAAGAVILEGDHALTEDPTSVDVASSYGDQTSEFEPGTPISEGQLDENARQLEDFVRTPHEEEQDTLNEEQQEISPISAIPPMPVSSPPPPSYDPPSVISRPSSSRPPSTRPPVPKASLLGEGEIQRTSSPAPTRAPPVPAAGRRESTLQASTDETEAKDEEVVTPQPTILAKPKPRMAEPAAMSDDEGEEEDKRAAASPESPLTIPSVAPIDSVAAAADTGELTEEEEDRQRRARISAKMARMGGQPIMGAPIAFRNPAAPTSAPISEDYMPRSEVEEAPEESAEEAFVSPPAPSRPSAASPPPRPTTMSPPPPVPQGSVPPVPTKSPPPPIMQGSGSLESRMSQMSTSEEQASLTRSASLLGRPPVPSARVARETSSATNIVDDLIDDEEKTFTPPPLPSSPPPRAPPPRAPVRQASQAEEEMDTAPAAMTASDNPRRRSSVQQQQPRRSASQSSDIAAQREAAPRSSRDLDLMPSSRWWRHGLPVKLPPTLMRPDASPIITTQDQGQQHIIRIELIFEDYSATVVEVRYEDDDALEEATQLSQHHTFAPRRPSSAELQSWSQRYGTPLAKQAISALQAKSAVGNGSSKDFISALVASMDEVLPPVGSSFGSIILAQAATTPVDVGADEVRVGDIVALHGVDFKGKKGLASYHATFGSTQEPTYACVIESEAKKRKLRCILVAGVEGKRSRIPEETSLRLDDVKSGLLRIFRLAPKSGWLSM